MEKVKFKLLDNRCKLTKAYDNAAAFDLYAKLEVPAEIMNGFDESI